MHDQPVAHRREQLFRVLVAAADHVALALVNDDLRAAALLHHAREAVVVGVDVRHQQRLHLREADAGVVELLFERVGRLRHIPAGVDERPAVAPFDEVRQHPAERVVRDRHLQLQQAVHDLQRVLRLDGSSHREPLSRAWSMPSVLRR